MPTQFPERDLGELRPGQKLTFGGSGPVSTPSSFQSTTMSEEAAKERLSKKDKEARKRIEKRERKSAKELEKLVKAEEKASRKEEADAKEEEGEPLEEQKVLQDKEAEVKVANQNDLLRRTENFNWFEDGDDEEENVPETVGHLGTELAAPIQENPITKADPCVRETCAPEEEFPAAARQFESAAPPTEAEVQDEEIPDTQKEDFQEADRGYGNLDSESDIEPTVEHVEHAEVETSTDNVPELSGHSEILSPVGGPITPDDVTEYFLDIVTEVSNVLVQTGDSEVTMPGADQTKEDAAQDEAVSENDETEDNGSASEGQSRLLTSIQEEGSESDSEEIVPDMAGHSGDDAREFLITGATGRDEIEQKNVSAEDGQSEVSASDSENETSQDTPENVEAPGGSVECPENIRDIDFPALGSAQAYQAQPQTGPVLNWKKVAIAVPPSFQPQPKAVALPATTPLAPTISLAPVQDIENNDTENSFADTQDVQEVVAAARLMSRLPAQDIVKILEETAIDQPNLASEATLASPTSVSATPATFEDGGFEQVPAGLKEPEKPWETAAPKKAKQSKKVKKGKQSGQKAKDNDKAQPKSVHLVDEAIDAIQQERVDWFEEQSIVEGQNGAEEESAKEEQDNEQPPSAMSEQATMVIKKQSYANRARSKKRKSKNATTVQELTAEPIVEFVARVTETEVQQPVGIQFAGILRLLSILGAFFLAVYIFMFIGKGLLDSTQAQREL